MAACPVGQDAYRYGAGVSVGDVVLGVIGGGVGTALIGQVTGVLDFRGKREDRRERRFSELFDQALRFARDLDPVVRAQGRQMLRSLAEEGKFSELEARLAGDLYRMHATHELEAAELAQASGRKVRFWTRVAKRRQDG